MLPPFMVSLPFKLMLFVLIDGWNILVRVNGLKVFL
jgi:flagellar biosynthetic protein FliP